MRLFTAILVFVLTLSSLSIAQDLPKVRIGYPLGLQNSSLAMIVNRGWDKANGFEIELVRFSGTATIVQGMFRGDIDLVVIAPTVIQTANNQGGDFKVIGATMINATDLYAVGDFAKQYDDTKSAEENIKIHIEQKSASPTLAYVGRSTAPGIMIHKWMREHNLKDKIKYVPSRVDQLHQLIASGAVDLAQTWEPFTTVLRKKQPNLKKIVLGKDMIKDQPLTALGGRRDYIENNADIVQKYMNLHVKATDMLKENPLEALDDYFEVINQNIVPKEDLKTALLNAQSYFESNPSVIIPPTDLSHDLLLEYGTFDFKPDSKELFDTSFYDNSINGE